MLSTAADASADAQLRRVRSHVEELRRAGRDEDAEALGFVRELAEQALSGRQAVHRRDLLTTGQAALALGISDQTVRNWVAGGRLSAVRRGVRTMIPRAVVLEEIERSRVRPAELASPTAREVPVRAARRRALLAALPPTIVARLNALHNQLEEGQDLRPADKAEIVRLEREMAAAAAHQLRLVIHHEQARGA